jgi:UDP-N-acetylmuramoyl-L-alanyl-D-glutamate--2,6-diaminopimelate ligase
MGHPSRDLMMVGVTGTNGKTTVSEMVKRGLEEAGNRCSLIGTLTGARTTPEGPELQLQLRSRADEGVDAVVMEVSSHALALHRVDGTRFDVAAFTNLGRDHLDFHGTTEAYFRAKARLFEPRLSDRAVINIDDPHGRLLRDTVDIPAMAVGLDEVDALAHEPWGSTFTWRDTEFRVPLAGSHNAANALVAAAVLMSLGVEAAVAAEGIAATPAVPGRFERVDHPGPISAVVDYAHTPDALEAVLRAARERTAGEVIVVFGCGGDRDATKRPIMGRVAAELGDLVILTTDNPRSESPAAIIEDVKRGVPSPEAVLVVPDRAEAIDEAIGRAHPDDLVVIAGKGHETTQIIGDRVLEFDDRIEARRAMDARAGGDTDR